MLIEAGKRLKRQAEINERFWAGVDKLKAENITVLTANVPKQDLKSLRRAVYVDFDINGGSRPLSFFGTAELKRPSISSQDFVDNDDLLLKRMDDEDDRSTSTTILLSDILQFTSMTDNFLTLEICPILSKKTFFSKTSAFTHTGKSNSLALKYF